MYRPAHVANHYFAARITGVLLLACLSIGSTDRRLSAQERIRIGKRNPITGLMEYRYYDADGRRLEGEQPKAAPYSTVPDGDGLSQGRRRLRDKYSSNNEKTTELKYRYARLQAEQAKLDQKGRELSQLTDKYNRTLRTYKNLKPRSKKVRLGNSKIGYGSINVRDKRRDREIANLRRVLESKNKSLENLERKYKVAERQLKDKWSQLEKQADSLRSSKDRLNEGIRRQQAAEEAARTESDRVRRQRSTPPVETPKQRAEKAARKKIEDKLDKLGDVLLNKKSDLQEFIESDSSFDQEFNKALDKVNGGTGNHD